MKAILTCLALQQTTHAMEEADLLADTVVIMRKGQVAASGSPLQLKAEHGSSLQFTLLVDHEDVDRTIDLIRERFKGMEEWVDIQSAGTGNVTVTISKIQGEGSDGNSVNGDGVDVETLAGFASFLESNESRVREYGFSNSSLEEVFLKVTEGDEEDESDESSGDQNDESSNMVTSDVEAGTNAVSRSVVLDDQVDGIASFTPKLSVRGQFKALLKFMVIRDWTGKSSIGNWVTHGVLLCLSVLLSVYATTNKDPAWVLSVIAFTLSVTLLTMGIPLYYERYNGLFYLTRAQGMLKNAYILSQVLYSYSLSFIFTFIVLSLVFATPLFRDYEVCEENKAGFECVWKYGDRVQLNWPGSLDWWDEFEGKNVRLFARRTPGHYGLILGIVAIFPLTLPGSVFASSHFPGFKIAITVLTMIVLGVSVAPLIIYASFNRQSDEDLQECKWDICNTTFFGNESSLDAEEFLNCVGLQVNEGQVGALCVPTAAGLLPQAGVFQTLYMAIMSDVTFYSEPPGYVESKLLPLFTGNYDCKGSTCQFPYAREQYSGYIGYMVLGFVILSVLGLLMLLVFSFPDKRVLQCKSWVRTAFKTVMHPFQRKAPSSDGRKDDENTIDISKEVQDEIQVVEDMVGPFVVTEDRGANGVAARIPNLDAVPRDEIPAIVAYKLRKEYTLPGGFGTKVALKSLDLHVPKGQVLGLLGKNGAGKSTALKIFAGGHEATTGVALVAGYDIGLEQIQAFERLGNCAQFDVIWPWETIKVHLEFFGGLKGLPKDRLSKIAHAVASSVGLGSPEVYNRRAGALSGGMRRRLSIAISLIGAPSVLLLDEPSKFTYFKESYVLVS